MNLSRQIRDLRYAKGWGPDELASRAKISRTALYQIERGNTSKPQAGTLRRICRALGVPLENLLEKAIDSNEGIPVVSPDATHGRRPPCPAASPRKGHFAGSRRGIDGEVSLAACLAACRGDSPDRRRVVPLAPDHPSSQFGRATPVCFALRNRHRLAGAEVDQPQQQLSEPIRRSRHEMNRWPAHPRARSKID